MMDSTKHESAMVRRTWKRDQTTNCLGLHTAARNIVHAISEQNKKSHAPTLHRTIERLLAGETVETPLAEYRMIGAESVGQLPATSL